MSPEKRREVGTALLTIREERLYRSFYTSFEDYCRERWGFQKTAVYQYIEAAKVMDNLQSSAIAEVLPANEAQARPLTTLKEPEQQRAAWQLANETACLTWGAGAFYGTRRHADNICNVHARRDLDAHGHD